jgi:hypothetical protein
MPCDHASTMPCDHARSIPCNWVVVSQLRGEQRCCLTAGHDGDHRFPDGPQPRCSLSARARRPPTSDREGAEADEK